MGKTAALPLVLVFLTASFLIVPLPVKAGSRTIVVPDDYPTIQAAIGNATAGDTVFVKKGTYVEDVTVDKPLSLIGEDSQKTVIKGVYSRYGENNVIHVTADDVTISSLTITGSEVGILIEDSYSHVPKRCKIINNNILDNYGEGILTRGDTNSVTGIVKPSNHIISGNNITGNGQYGIYVSSSNTTISGNEITGNSWEGIIADECINVTISQNNISNNSINDPITTNKGGLYLRWWGPFYVHGNNITDNVGSGIGFGEYCNNSTISNNNIKDNDIGIQLYHVGEDFIGMGTEIYQNNIEGNHQQVVANQTSDNVAFDNGIVGNYWSDYHGIDANNDDIGDTPYRIDNNNQDRYPLMKQVAIPEFPSWIILPLLTIVMIGTSLLVYFKKRKSWCL